MNNINSSKVMLVLGAVILFASIFAESIGLGDDPGFGRQQTTGVIFGIVVLAVGAYLHNKEDQSSGGGSDDSPGG